MFHLLRQRKRPHEVGQIVGQGVKLEPNLVVAELAARQSRPFDRVLAFLDVLLRFAPLVVEGHHPLGGAAQVRDNGSTRGYNLSESHSTLATIRRFLSQLPA